jgi:hypothetical protein
MSHRKLCNLYDSFPSLPPQLIWGEEQSDR